MKRTSVLTLVLMILVCVASIEDLWASGGVLLKTEDTGRYEIVILRTSNIGSAGPNEVILLDRDTGRTWTLKSENLAEGWVLMPRVNKPVDLGLAQE